MNDTLEMTVDTVPAEPEAELHTDEPAPDSAENHTEDTSASASSEGAPDESTPNELEALRAEVSSLRAQLEGERALYGRMSTECAEFSELYPTVPLSEIPDSIWESVKLGVPIAAAYALYEKRSSMARAKADLINSANSRASSGSIDSPPTEDFFSPAEVKAMSPAEVRKNYSTIIRSMSKWH